MTTRSTIYLVDDKWVYLVCLRMILPEMLPNAFREASYIAAFVFVFGYISLHLVSYLYFIMLVNILVLLLPNLYPIILKMMPAYVIGSGLSYNMQFRLIILRE